MTGTWGKTPTRAGRHRYCVHGPRRGGTSQTGGLSKPPPEQDSQEDPVGVSLNKGGNVSLTKAAPNLTTVIVGLGWDPRITTGADFDLDASALLLNSSGQVLSDQH